MILRNIRPIMTQNALSRTGMVQRHMAHSANKSIAKMMQDDALVQPQEKGVFGIAKLNRPSALNALNLEMIKDLDFLVKTWVGSTSIRGIILKGEGRAFCAGGDVVDVTNAAKDKNKRDTAPEFFRAEYQLDNYLAKNLRTPVVAFMDGITMGGGVGLAINSKFRVATEKTMFAMPETTIGLWPDVGASFFLPRLDGAIGSYLGLTSNRLDGWGAFQTGIATHYIPSDQLSRVEDRLCSLDATNARYHKKDFDRMIFNVLNEFAVNEPLSPTTFDLVGEKRKVIDRIFSLGSAEKIVEALKGVEESGEYGPALSKWAKETRETIEFRSPTSVKVALAAYHAGKTMDIDNVFLLDMRLASRFCDTNVAPDFVTGVDTLLVKKDKVNRPAWNPATLEEIPDSDIQHRFFAKTSPNKSNPIATPKLDQDDTPTFDQHPDSYGLPNELLISRIVQGYDKKSGSVAPTKRELYGMLETFTNVTPAGLEEKVEEILERKTTTGSQGELKWIY